MSSLPSQVVEKIAADPFAKFLGIELIELEMGSAVAQLTITSNMVNAHGTPHGGVIFSLADTALALASNSHGTTAVALDVSITYCRPVPVGSRVTATAVEENLTARTGLYQITVTREDGKLVASAKGTVFRTGQSF